MFFCGLVVIVLNVNESVVVVVSVFNSFIINFLNKLVNLVM